MRRVGVPPSGSIDVADVTERLSPAGSLDSFAAGRSAKRIRVRSPVLTRGGGDAGVGRSFLFVLRACL